MTEIDIAEIKAIYTQKAYKILGFAAHEWQPTAGFKANEAIMEAAYYAYQSFYFDAPQRFLWAGLARLTGGQVLFGMRNLTKLVKDPCVLTQEIVAVAKDIFDNLAWQHILFLENPDFLIKICAILDKKNENPHPFAKCWTLIAQNDAAAIAKGNMMLLENEQHATVQPHYNRIKTDRYSKPFFACTRFVMRNIHPYHQWFFRNFPFRDVTIFEKRWAWISHKKGMWQTWIDTPERERSRLIALDNEAIIQHRWR